VSAGKKADALGIDVTIMGREYRVACKPDEERDLRAAVAYVDEQMRGIRDAMRQNNAERVAVMAALNIANELLRTRSNPTNASTEADTRDIDLSGLKRRIQSMQSTIDSTLAEQERLL
jgi:cell division protein ZapA